MDNEPDYYTWSEFKDKVLKMMPLDANRLGMDDYLPGLIREAVIDLQDFIPSYKEHHESLYYPNDFASDGSASVGTLPPNSKLESVWLFKFEEAMRFPVVPWDWERRFELVHHNVPNMLGNDYMVLTAASFASIELINRLLTQSGARRRVGLMAPDPSGRKFYLYPTLVDGWVLSVNWIGRKLEFREGERVPFEEGATFAVADWAQSKIARTIDHDNDRATGFMRDYLLKRTNLFLENKDKARIQTTTTWRD